MTDPTDALAVGFDPQVDWKEKAMSNIHAAQAKFDAPTELAVVEPSPIVSVDQMRLEAEIVLASGLLPGHIKTWQQAVAIRLKGRELGIPPMEALCSLYVVSNKVSCDTKTMLALAYRSGKLESLTVEATEEKAVCTVKRHGCPAHTETFTMEDAKRLGLVKRGGNYETQPKTLLKWRAIAAGLRVVLPDAISGLYTHEEMQLPIVITEGENVALDAKAVSTGPKPTGPEAPAGETSGDSHPCPRCGGPTHRVEGQYGPFLGCSKFRETGCKGIVKINPDGKVDESGADSGPQPNVQDEIAEINTLLKELMPEFRNYTKAQGDAKRKEVLPELVGLETLPLNKTANRKIALEKLWELKAEADKRKVDKAAEAAGALGKTLGETFDADDGPPPVDDRGRASDEPEQTW